MAAEPAHINSKEDLQTLTKANKYLILDFWAEWCPPCKAIGPLFNKLAGEYTIPGKVAFAKVDVDAVPEVAAQFGVSAMPTFLFLVDGEPGPINVGGAVSGGGAVTSEAGELVMIRGADPKNLVGAAKAIAEIAKKEQEEEVSTVVWLPSVGMVWEIGADVVQSA
jgi:thioredoxin 1